MSKKKTDTINNLAQSLFGTVVTHQDLIHPGLALPHYALRYLFDGEGLPWGSIIQTVGDKGVGKSRFGYDLAALILACGGLVEVIDTENKTGLDTTMRASIGDELMLSGRLSFKHASAVDGDGVDEHGNRSWQNVLSERLDIISKNPVLCNIPILFFVDSICGTSTKDSAEKIRAAGSAQGQTMDHAKRAQSITSFLTDFKERLFGKKIIVLFSNHKKVAINIGGKPSFGGPEEYLLGGKGLGFFSTAILAMARGSTINTTAEGGNMVWMTLDKNSFGDENRVIQVPSIYIQHRNTAGELVLDEDGFPRRHLLFNWDVAAADIVKRVANEKIKASKTELKEALPGLEFSGSAVTCKSRGIVKLPMHEFGRRLSTDIELYKDMCRIAKLSIQHTRGEQMYPEHVPGWEREAMVDGWDEAERSAGPEADGRPGVSAGHVPEDSCPPPGQDM